MPPPGIATERLWLRKPDPFDIEELAPIYADPEVTRFLKDGTRTREQTAEIIETLRETWLQGGARVWSVLELKPPHHILGLCGFFREAELGYLFAKSAWGKGIATEAARACLRYGFEVAGYQTIGAGALRENSASLHILQKLGMSRRPNAYFDENGGVYFELERETWEKQKSM